jgi:O-antigen/teichoic acid export membrane protein
MKINQRKTGAILSYLSQGIQIMTTLVYTPIMLRLLGQSEYGLYQLVYSVVAYLSLLSFGFTASYMRFYANIKTKPDEDQIARLNGMFIVIFAVLAIICLICGGAMIWQIKAIFGNGLTSAEYETAKVLLIILVINMSLTFPSSVFDCITTAHEEFVFQKVLIVLQNILNPFLCLPLLIMGIGSVGIVTISLILTIIKFIVNVWFCLRKLHVKFKFNKFEFKLVKEIWVFTFFIFLEQIINQINWNLDKYLLGRISGTVVVAIYGVGNNIRSMYTQFSTAVSNVFVPRVNKIVAEQPNAEGDNLLTDLMTKIGRIQFIVLGLILFGFLLFGQEFIKLWVGNGYSSSYWVAALIIVPGTIPLIQNVGIEIQRAKNKHQMRSIVYACIGIGNIAISIPLILKMGAVGSALGTSISLFVGNVLFMNFYYHKKIGLNMLLFWKEHIKLFPALIPGIIAGIICKSIILVNSWLALFSVIIVYTVIYAVSMWMFGINSYEKTIVKSIANRKNRI